MSAEAEREKDRVENVQNPNLDRTFRMYHHQLQLHLYTHFHIYTYLTQSCSIFQASRKSRMKHDLFQSFGDRSGKSKEGSANCSGEALHLYVFTHFVRYVHPVKQKYITHLHMYM